MPKLLVVDDEPSVLQLFRRKFESEQLQVVTAESAAGGLELVDQEQPDVLVLDIVLPDKSGLDAFAQFHDADPKLPVIFMTATGNSDTAIEAMKIGAFDYLTKPLDFAKVRGLIEHALEVRRFMQEPVTVSDSITETPLTGDVLVGRCGAMQNVYKSIGRVASQNVTVLIRGESGTGKELIARALYHHSERSHGPFMEVNSAAIPEALLESELFGHEKGAFTGADKRRVGKFEQCNGGTIFLDEIGDMPPTLQSKMLRVLQEQRFERVGGNESIQTDVRVLAATNRDLEQMVECNEFRSDLYFRLNGFTINLPPLRDRDDDLLLLVDHFLARANRDLDKEVRGISPAALDTLKRYSWPGNVRELNNVIRQAVLQTTGPVLLVDFLPESVRLETEPPPTTSADDYWDQFANNQIAAGTESLYDEATSRMETELLTRVLSHTAGNQVEAARILGITRTTLRSKIKQRGIAIDRVVNFDKHRSKTHKT